MTSLQTISKILNTKDYSIVENNLLDRSYFAPYQDEFDFIKEHYDKYGNVPDKETFLSKFREFTIVEVSESDSYLLDCLQEEHLYNKFVPVIERSAELLQGNSIDAVNYLISNLDTIRTKVELKTVDIVHEAQKRYDEYYKRLSGQYDKFFISTGFSELDYRIHGWQRGEELVVLFARTNQGKSWVLVKTLTEAWHCGNNVGLISPEMSASRIGYRFDTLFNHFNNSSLLWGKEEHGYKEYIDSLSSHSAGFYVSTPQDFGGEVTVQKIKTFIKKNNLDIIGIDGISYIKDQRQSKYDNTQAQLTHISEDLFALSKELEVPIIIVVQANRDGVKMNGGNLELENIRDADGIGYNASKIIAIRQKSDEEILELTVKKNRDGRVGDKFIYQWNPPVGDFRYVPSEEDGNDVDREEKTQMLKQKFEKDTKIPF